MAGRQELSIVALGLIVCLNLVVSQVKAINFTDFPGAQSGGKYEAVEVIDKNPIQLIRMRGFKAELHYARTKDGYYIHVARIVNPLIDPHTELKRPVIFNHGLHETSTIWLINSHEIKPLPYTGQCDLELKDLNGTFYRNAAFMLANHGYDVWLMSMRGTDLSLTHDYLTPLDSQFWDYSLDDFALKDIPAVVEYVRTYTGSRKVGYIGHSQATFSIFALLSTYPSYADVIEPVIAVAPVAYFHHITSAGRAVFIGSLTTPARHLNGHFPPEPRSLRATITTVCAAATRAIPPRICTIIEAMMGGRGVGWLKGYFNHLPYMTSLKVYRHFGMLIKEKQFQRYDYGEAKNLEIYGTAKAPQYKIERIRSKSMCLISSKTDSLSAKKDVELFRKRLKVPLYKDIFINKVFDHFDMITDVLSGELVQRPILEIFDSIEVNSGFCHDHRYKSGDRLEEPEQVNTDAE